MFADGAAGTNLFHAGLETSYPPELWNVEYPDRVTTSHASFIAARVDIILTNCFGGTSFRLELHEAENSVNALNLAAARLARQAADAANKPVLVAWFHGSDRGAGPAPWRINS